MTRNKTTVFLVTIGLLCIAPLLLSNFQVSILTEILIFAIFALSLNILVGYTGLVSLGHAAFFAVGAYTAGIVAKSVSTNLILTLLAAILISVIVAAIIGFFSTKVSGFYFLMLTLAFSQMIYSIVHQSFNLTGGTNGLSGIPNPTIIGDVSFASNLSIYFLVLVGFILVWLFLRTFLKSPLGQILVGIRENEPRMKAMGYNTMLYKNLAFIIAGGLGGVAGSLYSYFNGFVAPSEAYWTMSGQVLIMVLIGGAGTLIGPVLGAAFIVGLETIVSAYTDLLMLIIGSVFILFVIFAPKGIVGIATSIYERFMEKRRAIHKQTPSPNVVKTVEKD
ncbi:branched-chain amino acid ABC transporter permease [Desertibacillus haloalkaliphilus]|uniref:branched-chain amino acid ABC transporter permease n=1 Tax=Desertibacillus haloalkaliphilus TaxID=1328930 RepID=UPI001C26B71C|nr:branched-chain amino acid ABC transporter permease [Desertibacillus haloalkaliphilus]MBU8908205.1 branched-chain amino acid ABC transporter permease [Desertibacillus haloalkaliphilus]